MDSFGGGLHSLLTTAASWRIPCIEEALYIIWNDAVSVYGTRYSCYSSTNTTYSYILLEYNALQCSRVKHQFLRNFGYVGVYLFNGRACTVHAHMADIRSGGLGSLWETWNLYRLGNWVWEAPPHNFFLSGNKCILRILTPYLYRMLHP